MQYVQIEIEKGKEEKNKNKSTSTLRKKEDITQGEYAYFRLARSAGTNTPTGRVDRNWMKSGGKAP